MEDFEQKELKRRKEDFRVEIRKNKQAKTFSANRKKLIQKLFEEEETTSSSSTSSQEKHALNSSTGNNQQNIFSISPFQTKESQVLNQQTYLNSNQSNLTSSNSLKVYLIYSLQEIDQLVVEFVDYIQKSTQQLIQNNSQQIYLDNAVQTDILIAQSLLKEVLQPLLKYEDLFKQVSEKNCHLFEQSQVHIRLFEYLQNIINTMQFAMSLDLQGAEALLCKVFQYLVNVCLNSEKALDDCFSLGIINYFINIMISSNFYKQKSKMILFSVNLLDHIASRNNSEHIKILAEKEITRQILTLMTDIQKSIQEQQQQLHQIQQFDMQTEANVNNELKIDSFYRKLLVHLSSILSNISSNKDLIDQPNKDMLIQICQELLFLICKDLNEKSKQLVALQKFYQTLPHEYQNQGMKSNLDEEEEELSEEINTLQKKQRFRPPEEQKIYEELAQIEENLGACLLNIIEMMEADDLDEYISNNISFLVFSQSQILPVEEQNQENSQRIQIYGELMNGLLMGEEDQIELVIDTFQILDYIKNLIYSNYNNLVITGLICLFDILISATQSQFDQICENDQNIICRLLQLINHQTNNTQLQVESLKTLSAFVDRAPKQIIDYKLRPTNIINIIIQKMDPENESAIIKSALTLLESLLKSEECNDNEEFEEEHEDIEEANHNQINKMQTLKHTSDNYWALKFQSNPAGNNIITKLINSLHSTDIILQLSSILDEYID
ncbi:importin beta-binding domain protein (macronuclear) [Tetrahymena thermophila SB210]|uniref:Importin beta-binding domain protein n=1 Tax=Tetrahymena thermophila (strain SB210) TaxID=312017 RepID=I7MFY4_TETTS|nr:importin beta-binding domain protein [Tetrahymena thermophila SB210]EAS00794.1 importin beta-binding domain protein [Tetrahymena thermophila SB210]|eukprot:XP_001021039.1 importin beta-binding domain protein [Tetrahymena thermophila SB210]